VQAKKKVDNLVKNAFSKKNVLKGDANKLAKTILKNDSPSAKTKSVD